MNPHSHALHGGCGWLLELSLFGSIYFNISLGCVFDKLELAFEGESGRSLNSSNLCPQVGLFGLEIERIREDFSVDISAKRVLDRPRIDNILWFQIRQQLPIL